ncbi:unnamed protein product, partial [Protopolystoma xenopodis]
MVVRCVHQLVNSHASNIRSGWPVIFAVFQRLAATSSDEVVIDLAFSACQFVVQEVLPLHFYILVSAFQ